MTTQPIIAYRVGKRTAENTRAFVAGLRERVLGAPEISPYTFLQGQHPPASSGELTALAAILILRRFPARCFGGTAWPARRGEESGDDARFRHDEPAKDGGRNRVAGGPATTIVRAGPTYPQFYRVYRAGENP
jgi:hypothetical protein